MKSFETSAIQWSYKVIADGSIGIFGNIPLQVLFLIRKCLIDDNKPDIKDTYH